MSAFCYGGLSRCWQTALAGRCYAWCWLQRSALTYEPGCCPPFWCLPLTQTISAHCACTFIYTLFVAAYQKSCATSMHHEHRHGDVAWLMLKLHPTCEAYGREAKQHDSLGKSGRMQQYRTGLCRRIMQQHAAIPGRQSWANSASNDLDWSPVAR